MEYIEVLIADKSKNKLMKSVDMCSQEKVFVSSVVKIPIEGEITESKIKKIIEESRNSPSKTWCPMVIYKGKRYVADGINFVSDGTYEYNIKKET